MVVVVVKVVVRVVKTNPIIPELMLHFPAQRVKSDLVGSVGAAILPL